MPSLRGSRQIRPEDPLDNTSNLGEKGPTKPEALPVVILASACLVMLGVLLYVGRWLVFWRDEWVLIFTRPDPTPRSVIAPFFDTLIAIPVLVYQALLAVFGLRSYLPYLLVDWGAHFVVAFLLYRIVKRRSGTVLGLVAGISTVFLGSGFEVLLQPFQLQYLLAIIGGLVAIDQLDVGRPAIAAIALLPAVASSGLGVIYAGLIVVWGILRRHPPTILAAVPAIVAYGWWYVGWGAEIGHLSGPGLNPIEGAYSVIFGMGAAVSGVTGLPPERFALVGVALAVGVLVGVGVLARGGYRPDPLAGAAIAALAAEQILRALNRGQFGVEYGARSGYVYAGVVFVWLVICGLVGNRLPKHRAVPLIAAILIVPMVLGNMRQFAGAAVTHRDWRATELAELQLIESLRADPHLALDVQPDDTTAIEVRPGPYLTAIDRFGRPTLGYDWQPNVDAAAVEAARSRLLTGSP
jgi:hypothetical protein